MVGGSRWERSIKGTAHFWLATIVTWVAATPVTMFNGHSVDTLVVFMCMYSLPPTPCSGLQCLLACPVHTCTPASPHPPSYWPTLVQVANQKLSNLLGPILGYKVWPDSDIKSFVFDL